MKLPHRFRRSLLTILALVVLLLALAVLFEEHLIYFPSTAHEVTPDQLALRYDDVTLDTEDGGRVHAWFLPATANTEAERWTVLMSHGNAGNISHRLDRTLLMHANLGVDVLLYDYRGFGKSEGSPTEERTYADGRAAYRYLVDVRGVPPNRIVLFGESLGTAVSVQLATELEAAALVLEAPFTSIADMATVYYPFVPTRWIRTRYASLEKVASLRMPLFVIHGTEDRTVPFEQGRRLFEAAPEPKTFLDIEGAGHTDTFFVGHEMYWDAWTAFFDSLRPAAETEVP